MTKIGRRDFIKNVGVATTTFAVSRSLRADRNDTNRPNVVFILADDMGYGDITSLNSDSQIPTPNIDRLTKGGRYFTDAHSPSALCTPTRYGVLTGRYCFRTRVKRSVLWGYSRHLIEPERTTVASLLKSQGYNTACIGKWHLGMDMPAPGGGRIPDPDHRVDRRAYKGAVDWNATIDNGPLSVGFDTYYGIPASLDMYPYIWIENDRFVGECTAEDDLLFITEQTRGQRYGDNIGPAHPDFRADEVMPTITRKTVSTIEEQSAETPFFVYMSLTAPHIPIVPSAPFRGRSEIGPYGDFCIEVDDGVGQVLDALERKGLAEQTLVVFTADNGCAPYIGVEDMNEQGHYPSYIYRGYKSDIYEGGHRVPFIARWPQRIPAATHSDETICLTDLLATCASITDTRLTQNAGEDSYDILPALVGGPLEEPIREATVSQAGDGSYSIRQGRWKLELTPSSGGYDRISPDEARKKGLPAIQLYDLSADIGERTNLYDRNPEVVNSLKRLLEKYRREGRSAPHA
ncbi:MAG: arylsulfatase [Acidobacteriota bacterium]|nr:arylsulfatase [Acidobacteriota bacterium]